MSKKRESLCGKKCSLDQNISDCLNNNWSKSNFLSILNHFCVYSCSYILLEMMEKLNTKYHLCRSWGSWVMLQIVSKYVSVIKIARRSRTQHKLSPFKDCMQFMSRQFRFLIDKNLLKYILRQRKLILCRLNDHSSLAPFLMPFGGAEIRAA